MALDDDVARLLATLATVQATALSEGTPEQARANYAAAPKPPGDPLPRVEDRSVPGPAGPIAVRLYAASTEPGLPVVAFFHGGGWVISSVDGHDSLARRLADRVGSARRVGRVPARPRAPVPRARTTTAGPSPAGWPTTPPSGAATRPASPWPATRPAATWRPAWPCGHATRASPSPTSS